MPRPTRGYTLHDGSKAPGVTSIIGRFDNKSRLINWANKVGLEGKSLKEIQTEAFQDGKDVHFVFENIIKRRDIAIPEKLQPFADKLLAVLKKYEIVDVLSEIPMSSEMYKFGGTPDLIVKTKAGESIVFDFKFTSMLTVSVAYQMGAYRILLEENTGRVAERAVALHLDKKKFKNGLYSLQPVEIVNLKKYADIFLQLRSLYDVLEDTEDTFEVEKRW
jgi:hypothetical protein